MTTGSEVAVSSSQLECAEHYRRRRATSVLCPVFGDISDSTRLLEELGEPKYYDLRQSHELLIRTVVERDDEGALLQTYGDGFLAVFSEPSTAIERSLEIQERLGGHLFRLRIGIDMGQVATKRTSGIVSEIFGRHVNRASRIQAKADPGSVLASFSVYDSAVGWLRDTVLWTHHPATHLKGFADPITLHEPSSAHTVCASAEGDTTAIEDSKGTVLRLGSEPVDATRYLPGASDPYNDVLSSIRETMRQRPPRIFTKVRILWVDDFPENNSAIGQQLSGLGLRITFVRDTAEALPAMRRKSFAAIISDMERGDDPVAGLGLLDGIRRAGVQVPCLIFTSPQSEAEHADDAVARGARICTSGTVSLLRCLDVVLRNR